jgi:GNAT superfamily N-acetyltransferase
VSESELEYRRAGDADRTAIIELLRRSLGREVDARYEALFAWKHVENAFGASPAWVACDGDRLAGLRVLMRWEFVDGGQVVRAVRAVDTATDPDYQGRGIFTRLTLHAIDEQEGVEFVFNTPNDQSRPGYLKMGWEVVGQLPTLVRPTGWRSIPRIAQARVPAERWSTPSAAGLDARTVLDDTAAVDALLARIGGPRPAAEGLSTHLTSAFLRWRYGTPLLGYRAVVAPGGVAAGMAIFRVRARGAAKEVALGAVLVPEGDRRTASRLVRAVARAADADYLLAIGHGPFGPGGLVRLPRVGPLLTYRAVTAVAPPVAWDLTLGDIELF